jgi:hypothetical protein
MKPGAFEQRNKQSIRQLSNAKHTISEQRFIEFHRFIGVPRPYFDHVYKNKSYNEQSFQF